MNDNQLIHLCACSDISTGGGFQTYVSSLVNHGIPGVGERVITSLEGVDQSQFQLLHAQEEMILKDIDGKCPALFTAHNHTPYCPSGTKYLLGSGISCDRSMSVLGCTWGHLVDRCGSRRPHSIIKKVSGSYRLLGKLKELRIPVIANSDYVRQQLIVNGLPPEQTVTLRCGTPTPASATAPLTPAIHQNQRILFAGRIVPDKGLEWLVKSLAEISSVHLDVAGEGWDRSRIEALVNRLGLTDRVTWHGWCDLQKIDSLYQECFAVVFPSVWPEPAGLITLEAYARYRPTIASNVGGIPEHLHDGETGILVSVNDIKQLAAAMTELSTNYQKTRYLGERGHALFLREFTMDVHVSNLQKIYDQTIEDFHNKRLY